MWQEGYRGLGKGDGKQGEEGRRERKEEGREGGSAVKAEVRGDGAAFNAAIIRAFCSKVKLIRVVPVKVSRLKEIGGGRP